MFAGTTNESKVCGLVDGDKKLWFFKKCCTTRIGYLKVPHEQQIEREERFYTNVTEQVPNFISMTCEVPIGLFDDTSVAYVIDTNHKLWLASTNSVTLIPTPFDVFKVGCVGIHSYVIDTHGHIWRRLHPYVPQVTIEENFTLIENLPPVRNWAITKNDIFLVCGSELWSFRNRSVITGLPESVVDIAGDETLCVLLTESGAVWNLKFARDNENLEQSFALPATPFDDEDYIVRAGQPYLWCECAQITGLPKITSVEVALSLCYAIDENGFLWKWPKSSENKIFQTRW